MSNFDFLKDKWSDLAKYAEFAERSVYSDPNNSIIKQGMCAEFLVKYIFAYEKIDEPVPVKENTHANRIKILKRQGLLPKEIDNILYIIRQARNDASHQGFDDVCAAEENLPLLYTLCVWYMQVYGDYDFEPKGFIKPERYKVDISQLAKDNEELTKRCSKLELEIELVRNEAERVKEKRQLKYAKKIFGYTLTEAQTRKIIDEKLRAVGWEVDTENLTYAKGAKPKKGKNRAISEWPTDSVVAKNGYADYALFIGEKLVGIIEAKRKHSDVSAVIDGQCKDYAKMIKKEHQQYIIKEYGEYKVPFLFATNGREYIKQLETKSGIWFLDVRETFNSPKALSGWPSPEGLEQDLEKDIAMANKKLESTGYEILEDKNALGLRYYQIEAIKAAEKAVIDGSNSVLLAMATGTGKTRTVLGMIYRFLSAKRFKRILYLVDRTALGDQTMDTIKTVRLDDLKTLNQIYDIKDLGEKEFEKDTRVQIATVQSLVKRIMYNDDDTDLGVSDYDLIIVDEAHRGYILDKEMDDSELLYRNQDDFRSKYRAVIDYFDAVKIALTATPALHTTEIFGKPVYEYSYRRAVIDGYLCDYDAPTRIITELSKEGISFKAGEKVPVWYSSKTDPIISELEDDLKFEVKDFNKKVLNKSFNETVLEEFVKNIDIFGEEKTLIFAADDEHADVVVDVLKNIYSKKGGPENAIMKITGSIENGNSDKIREKIRRFKNEQFPNVVVTVDLLSTGIDVEEICNIVFLRRIQSRILFEQMLGRATRLCPKINKTHFNIYDAVGIYDILQSVTDMKPVVSNPETTLEILIDGLDVLKTEEQRQEQIEKIIAKLNRIKNRISKEDKIRFETMADISEGKTSLEDFIDKLRSESLEGAIDLVKRNKDSLCKLKEGIREGGKIISDKVDHIDKVEKLFGDGKTKPEDYLQEFHDFIYTHMNEIAAINIIATKPSSLTKKSLADLKYILSEHHFSETELNTAWRAYKNEDIVADIIGFIRQRSIGDVLISKDDRIHNAISTLMKKHPEFDASQKKWLDRIESYLKKETVLNRETFDAEAFKNMGGYNVVNRAFDNKLDAIVEEINNYMYSA